MANSTPTAYDVRVAEGLATLAWAYFAALDRSRYAEAAGILIAFQQGYNRYRGALMETFSDPGYARSFLPSALSSGRYDHATKVAMAAALLVGFSDIVSRSVVDRMPSSASAALAWWRADLKRLARSGWVDAMVEDLLRANGANAAAKATGWLSSYITVAADTEGLKNQVLASIQTPDVRSPTPDLPVELPGSVVIGRAPPPVSGDMALGTKLFLGGLAAAVVVGAVYYVRKR